MSLLTAFLASILTLNTWAAPPIFYPSAPDQPRIQFLKTISGGNFFLPANPYGNRFPDFHPALTPDKDGLIKPYGIALSKGKIFVCDSGAGLVRIFNLEKKFLSNLGDQNPGKLTKPINIAIAEDDSIYVVDVIQSKILVYNSENVFIKAIGDGKTVKPTDLVLSKGKLYVTDMAKSQIVVFDPKTSKELFRISKGGYNVSNLVRGTNITADPLGNIYVSDALAGKISVFSENGKFIRNFGAIGDSLGQFTRAKGLALDHENRLYVVDNAFENVQIFNDQDQLLMPFGDVGNNPGGLNMPAKVTIDYNHNKYFKEYVAPGFDIEYLILVSNQFGNNRVNVYGFLKKI